MTTSRDIDRLLEQWLDTGLTHAPLRVLDTVADRIDRQPQRPAWRLRWRDSNMGMKTILAASAAIAIVALAFGLGRWSAPTLPFVGAGASPTIPLDSPGPASGPPAYQWPGSLEPGEYTTSLIWDLPFQVAFTLPDGWAGRDIEVIKTQPGGTAGVAVAFMLVDNVYADPCGRMLQDPPVGSSVGALANAIASIPDIEATEPVPVTFDRLTTGRYLEFSLAEDAGCEPSKFFLWRLDQSAMRPNLPQGGPDFFVEQPHNRVWVLDVGGTRFVIAGLSSPTAPAADVAELEAVIDSIRIVHAGSTPPPEPAPS